MFEPMFQLLDVSRGMLYLHSAKIVHGDLKARNVLISDDEQALVADFGLAEFERHNVIPSRAGSTSSHSMQSIIYDVITPLEYILLHAIFQGFPTVEIYIEIF